LYEEKGEVVNKEKRMGIQTTIENSLGTRMKFHSHKNFGHQMPLDILSGGISKPPLRNNDYSLPQLQRFG